MPLFLTALKGSCTLLIHGHLQSAAIGVRFGAIAEVCAIVPGADWRLRRY